MDGFWEIRNSGDSPKTNNGWANKDNFGLKPTHHSSSRQIDSVQNKVWNFDIPQLIISWCRSSSISYPISSTKWPCMSSWDHWWCSEAAALHQCHGESHSVSSVGGEYKLHWVQTTRSPDGCWYWWTNVYLELVQPICFTSEDQIVFSRTFFPSSRWVFALLHDHGPIPRMLWLPFAGPFHEWPLLCVLIKDQVKINNDLTSGLRWLRNFCHKFKEARPNINILLWGPEYQIRSPGRNGDGNLNWVL